MISRGRGVTRTIHSIFSVVALLLIGGCGESAGTTYQAPIDKVYEKLTALDMGADIGSAVFMYTDSSPPVSSEENKTVTWHMGGPRGSDVVAHLTANGDNQTNVVVDVIIPEANMASMPLPFQNMAKNMIRERIAAHIEDRKFDDQKFMDAMYGGSGSLVPQGIRDQGMAAQRMYAEERRAQAEMEKDAASDSSPSSPSSSVTQSDVRSAAPMVDTAQYNRR